MPAPKWESASKRFSRPSSIGSRRRRNPRTKSCAGLVFDCVFDIYRGVVAYVRIFSGEIEAGQGIKLMNNDARYEVKEVGVFTPEDVPQKKLQAGDVGYFIANIKSTADIKIGDTVTDLRHPAKEPLPGFQEIHPMVFSGIYPINTGDFEHLKTAIGKLRLNDSAFVYQPESSVALGFRIPLRLSRLVAHGDHAGTAPARIRHGHYRHVTQRHL